MSAVAPMRAQVGPAFLRPRLLVTLLMTRATLVQPAQGFSGSFAGLSPMVVGRIPRDLGAGALAAAVMGDLPPPDLSAPEPADAVAVATAAALSGLCALVLAVVLRPAPAPAAPGLPGETTRLLDQQASPSSVASSHGPAEPLGKVRIWGLTAINLAYGFSLALQGMVVAPLDAERLWPGSSSLALGALVALCGLAQLVGPEAGHWSDTWRSPIGRRRPLVLITAALVSTFTLGLWLFSRLRMATLYIIVFFAQQVAWNVLSSTQLGLVPDLVPPSQRGFAGGASAANVLVGALAAFVVVITISTWDYHVHYGIMVALLVLSCGIVCVAANEESSMDRLEKSEGPWMQKFLSHYWLDFRTHHQFAMLLVTKTLYCAATVVKGFLLYFTQDTFRLPGAAQEQELTARMAIMAEAAAAGAALCAMLVLDDHSAGEGQAMPGGEASASPASKFTAFVPAHGGTASRSLVALGVGAAWMGLLWYGPLGLGWKIKQEFPNGGRLAADAWGNFMIWGTSLWGLGQGLYLAGDQSLSFALVPNQDQAAQYLSLNSVCAFVGASIGGIFAGGLLEIFGSGAPDGQAYAFEGYAAIFIFASVLCLSIGAVAIQMRLNSGQPK